MPQPTSFCFRSCAAGAPSSPPAAGPSISTSVYETLFGFASLIWSRNLFGLSLRACFHEEDGEDSPLEIRIRPWILWKRRGARRLYLTAGLRRRTVDIAWDLTRARFPSAGSPEPCSGFFVAVSVDGEIWLVAGDLGDEAQRKVKGIGRSPGILVSRQERVFLKGDGEWSTYRTALRIGGKEREIGIDVGGKERQAAGMFFYVDGAKVLQVRPLKWKFRGSAQIEIDGDRGRRILISWDLHAWFSRCKENHSPPSAAVFVFCFEGDGIEKGVSGGDRRLVSGFIGGRSRNWSEESSVSGGIGGDGRKGRKKILMKTSSLSSTSSAASSSAASSSVADWESTEEAEMRGVDGFTLVVHAWKT